MPTRPLRLSRLLAEETWLRSVSAGVRIFDWPDLKGQRTIEAAAANLHCLAFSPNERLLAVGGGNPSEEGVVEIFSWPEAISLGTVRQHEDSVTSVVWLDDSQFFSASIDRKIHLCQRHGSVVRSYIGHSRSVTAICLLSDGETLVSVGEDQSVRVWDVSSGKLTRSMRQHTRPIHYLALRPVRNGLPQVASAAGDRTIRFWQPSIGRMVRYVRLDAEPLNVAWTTSGDQILATCVDGRIRVIDPAEVSVVGDLPAVNGWAYAIAVHPDDGTIAVGGSDGQLRRIHLR